MENGLGIVQDLKAYISDNSNGIMYATYDKTADVCNYHAQLLLCIDGYISCMKTKSFYLTPEIIDRQKKYQRKILAWEIFLSMSITTKSHLVEDHSGQQ